MLLISPKEVDQQAVEQVSGMEICILPAVGLKRGGEVAFLKGFARSYQTARRLFRTCPPQAALAMGGFTSAPPILAARRSGAKTFLHESNSIPGRANRWLSWLVDRAFVGFPSASGRLHTRRVTVTGTPVRPQFQTADPAACRTAVGLDPSRPVVLVMGGSQGASGINEMVMRTLPLLAERAPELQWMHLTGAGDADKVTKTYATLGIKAVVHPFFNRMELALGAATVAVSRSGASSLAELAAMRLPAVLVPFPAATANHQFHNARAFEAAGAARLLEQKNATPETLANMLSDLLEKPAVHEQVRDALAAWHVAQAAERIAEMMLAALGIKVRSAGSPDAPPAASSIAPPEKDLKRTEPAGPSLSSRMQVRGALPTRGQKSALRRQAQVTA
jgi:UDP-N-acetylglucosamine--N-acetylmuramyl-(pentapeptide) pyrophosphoryl-undecaprenol N-acetylglucosamine transferase